MVTEMLFAQYHKFLQMSTRLNCRSPRKQCQWNRFKKKWSQVTITTKVPTSCWLTAKWYDQEDQSREQKYQVAIETGYRGKWSYFRRNAFREKSECKAFFQGKCSPWNLMHLPTAIPSFSSFWPRSKTDAYQLAMSAQRTFWKLWEFAQLPLASVLRVRVDWVQVLLSGLWSSDSGWTYSGICNELAGFLGAGCPGSLHMRLLVSDYHGLAFPVGSLGFTLREEHSSSRSSLRRLPGS